MNIKILKMTFVSCVLAYSGFTNAGLITNFTDNYDVRNWTHNLNSGSIYLNETPNAISLISGNSGFADFTDLTIAAVDTGVVKFDWSYTTEDWGQEYDPFGVLINGGYTQLTGSSSSGTYSWNVTTGDVFGFRVRTTDGIYGSSTTTVSNFSALASTPALTFSPTRFLARSFAPTPALAQAPVLAKSATVPEPSTFAILALGIVGLASRRFKKQS